jgi:hypothetical protein
VGDDVDLSGWEEKAQFQREARRCPSGGAEEASMAIKVLRGSTQNCKRHLSVLGLAAIAGFNPNPPPIRVRRGIPQPDIEL